MHPLGQCYIFWGFFRFQISKYQNINTNNTKIATAVESYPIGIQGFCCSVARRVHWKFYKGWEDEYELRIRVTDLFTCSVFYFIVANSFLTIDYCVECFNGLSVGE